MPGLTYPPPAPTISGDFETISRFLNTPTLVQRRLRSLAENRFIGDVILPNAVPAQGGAILYEQTESIFPDRKAESVAPGARYPTSTVGFGPAAIAAVEKWGLDAIVTDEDIRRLNRNPVDRAMTKLTNGVVQQFDSVCLAAINAAPIQSFSVPTAWLTSTRIIRDVQVAKAQITALNQGYVPDTVVMDDATGAIISSDDKILTAMRREATDNIVYTGYLGRLLGLDFFYTPNLPIPGKAYVMDRTQVGGTGNEQPLTGSSIREEDGPKVVEGWVLRAKRIAVPFVQEPNAVVRIDGI